MKKTLRLLITLDCNLSCSYCYNRLPEINSKFTKKRLEDIDFTQYEVICITGGEPLLKRNLINNLFNSEVISWKHSIYLYTNGLLLKDSDIQIFDGINIGIHYREQVREILENSNVLSEEVKFCVQDIYREEYLPNIPDRYVKTWEMNSCFNNIETEDWVLLEE